MSKTYWILYACTILFGTHWIPVAAQTTPQSSSTVILLAFYGVLETMSHRQRVDVTETLQAKNFQSPLKLEAKNKSILLGISDPAPKNEKTVLVIYKQQGILYLTNASDNAPLTIPDPQAVAIQLPIASMNSNEIVVLKALLGNISTEPLNKSCVDVTKALQGCIKNGQMVIPKDKKKLVSKIPKSAKSGMLILFAVGSTLYLQLLETNKALTLSPQNLQSAVPLGNGTAPKSTDMNNIRIIKAWYGKEESSNKQLDVTIPLQKMVAASQGLALPSTLLSILGIEHASDSVLAMSLMIDGRPLNLRWIPNFGINQQMHAIDAVAGLHPELSADALAELDLPTNFPPIMKPAPMQIVSARYGPKGAPVLQTSWVQDQVSTHVLQHGYLAIPAPISKELGKPLPPGGQLSLVVRTLNYDITIEASDDSGCFFWPVDPSVPTVLIPGAPAKQEPTTKPATTQKTPSKNIVATPAPTKPTPSSTIATTLTNPVVTPAPTATTTSTSPTPTTPLAPTTITTQSTREPVTTQPVMPTPPPIQETPSTSVITQQAATAGLAIVTLPETSPSTAPTPSTPAPAPAESTTPSITEREGSRTRTSAPTPTPAPTPKSTPSAPKSVMPRAQGSTPPKPSTPPLRKQPPREKSSAVKKKSVTQITLTPAPTTLQHKSIHDLPQLTSNQPSTTTPAQTSTTVSTPAPITPSTTPVPATASPSLSDLPIKPPTATDQMTAPTPLGTPATTPSIAPTSSAPEPSDQTAAPTTSLPIPSPEPSTGLAPGLPAASTAPAPTTDQTVSPAATSQQNTPTTGQTPTPSPTEPITEAMTAAPAMAEAAVTVTTTKVVKMAEAMTAAPAVSERRTVQTVSWSNEITASPTPTQSTTPAVTPTSQTESTSITQPTTPTPSPSEPSTLAPSISTPTPATISTPTAATPATTPAPIQSTTLAPALPTANSAPTPADQTASMTSTQGVTPSSST